MSQHPAVDVGAAGVIVSSILGWLPPIAAGLSIAWYLYLFYEKISAKYRKK